GMSIFAYDLRITVAKTAADASHDGQRQSAFNQHRSLLDMQFGVTAQVRYVPVRNAFAHRSRIKAKLVDVFGECPPRVHASDIQTRRRKQAQRSFRPDIGIRKPGTFFGPNRHHRDGICWRELRRLPGGDNSHAGDDPRGAVEISTLWDRIQMRGDQEGAGPAPLEREVKISAGVVRDVKPELPGSLGHQVVCELFTGPVRCPGDAGTLARMFVERIKKSGSEREIWLGNVVRAKATKHHEMR